MAGAKHTAPLGGITGAVIENGERFLMKTLAKRYPSVDAVLAELANLEAVLTLPRPRVHIVSDVHGEYVKLRQVVANASGSLRPLVERVSTDPELLSLIYYPRVDVAATARRGGPPRAAAAVRAADDRGDALARAPLHAQVGRPDHSGPVRRDVPRDAVRARAGALAGVRRAAGRSVRAPRPRSRAGADARARDPQPRDRRADRRGRPRRSRAAHRQGDRDPRGAAARRRSRAATTTPTGSPRASAIPPRSRRSCGCRCATSASLSSRRATASRSSRSRELARAVYGDDPADVLRHQGRLARSSSRACRRRSRSCSSSSRARCSRSTPSGS